MSNRRVVLGRWWLLLGVLAGGMGMAPTRASADNPTKWCVMAYMNAAHGPHESPGAEPLEAYAIRDIFQMQRAIRSLDPKNSVADPTIRVFVQFNRHKPKAPEVTPTWDSTLDNDYDGCHRFELTWTNPATLAVDSIPSDDLTKKTALQVSGTPIDMTQPQNLQDFIVWSQTQCPDADHYLLVMWNPVSDWVTPQTVVTPAAAYNGYGATPKDCGQPMTIYQLTEGVTGAREVTGKRIELIYFDAPQVATMENLYSMTHFVTLDWAGNVLSVTPIDLCDWIVASELATPKVGADYSMIIKDLWDNAKLGPRAVGELMALDTENSLSAPDPAPCQSDVWGAKTRLRPMQYQYGVFDMSQVSTFTDRLNDFAIELSNEFEADPNGPLPVNILTWYELSLVPNYHPTACYPQTTVTSDNTDTIDLMAFAAHAYWRGADPNLRAAASALFQAELQAEPTVHSAGPAGIVNGVSIYYPCNLMPYGDYFGKPMSKTLDWCYWLTHAPLGYGIGFAPDAYDLDGDAVNAYDAFYYDNYVNTPGDLNQGYMGKHWFYSADDTDCFQFWPLPMATYVIQAINTGPWFDGRLYVQSPDGTFAEGGIGGGQEMVWGSAVGGRAILVVVQNDETGLPNPYGGRTYYDLEVIGDSFHDVPLDSWAAQAVFACTEAGIVQGSGGSYLPGSNVTRDEMATFMARALCRGDANVPDGPATPSFSDVPASHWAYKYVEYCKQAGVVQGSGNTYDPEATVNRGQMATFLARALCGGDAAVPAPTPYSLFADVTETYWAHKYIDYCFRNGLAQGYGDRTYQPEAPVTRDQMAVFMTRAFLTPVSVRDGGQP